MAILLRNKSKFLLFSFLIIMFPICFLLSGCGAEETYDSDVANFSFELQSDDTYSIITYTGSSKYIEIPSEYNGKKITTISSYFSDLSIEKVIVSEGITTLEGSAFCRCTNLLEIYLPSTLSSFGDNFLNLCEKVNVIEVAEGNEKYYSEGNCIIQYGTSYVVKGCQNSIIPNDGSVLGIGYRAFMGSGIETITIPESVVYISSIAFGKWSDNTTYLTMAYFENTEGWHLYDGTEILSENLSDPSIAALYLRSTYLFDYWYCSTN